MGVEPVSGGTVAGRESDLALVNALHLLDDDALDLFKVTGNHIKVKFVVNLQNHFGLDALLLEAPVDAHHGEFDDIGSGALDGCVDGVTLAESPHYGIS